MKTVELAGRANLRTGLRKFKRTRVDRVVVERVVADKIRPVVVAVGDAPHHAAVEMAEADVFELAMALLEHGLSADYIARSATYVRRLSNLALAADAIARRLTPARPAAMTRS